VAREDREEVVNATAVPRVDFVALLDVFRRSTGETAAYNARHILNAIDAYPDLAETIPEADLQLALPGETAAS
jgi:hypothetical protein